jgi:hypothetical protein
MEVSCHLHVLAALPGRKNHVNYWIVHCKPVSMAVRSEAYALCAKTLGSNLAQAMDVCLRLFTNIIIIIISHPIIDAI